MKKNKPETKGYEPVSDKGGEAHAPEGSSGEVNTCVKEYEKYHLTVTYKNGSQESIQDYTVPFSESMGDYAEQITRGNEFIFIGSPGGSKFIATRRDLIDCITEDKII